MKRTRLSAFTLIELIVVIGILATLVAIVILAVNPGRQFALARNAQRRSNTRELANAINQWATDNKGGAPASIATTPIDICNGKSGVTCAANTIDMRALLVPQYLADIPKDPLTGTDADTGYAAVKDSTGRVVVETVNTEQGVAINGGGTAPSFALQFNGVNNNGSIPSVPSMIHTGSMSFWVNVASTTAGSGWIMGSYANFGIFQYGDGNVYFRNGNGIQTAVSILSWTPGTWHHVAMTWTGTSFTGYFDGVAVTSGGQSGDQYNNVPYDVANISAAGGYYYGGQIDDIRFFNRPLSGSEVSQLYNGGTIGSGLVGWWDFNDGAGTTVRDKSGSGYTMSLINSPQWVTGLAGH